MGTEKVIKISFLINLFCNIWCSSWHLHSLLPELKWHFFQTRAQSAVMAEQYLANLDQDEQCFHRSYCEASIKEAAEGTARAAKEAIK